MIKTKMKKRNKRMRMGGARAKKGKVVCCKMGINKIGEGWWERERGASGGDWAGGVVGVVVEAVGV